MNTTTKRTIRWGIIGCGDGCEIKSGPGFYKSENSALSMVMRRDADKAADYAKRHNVPQWTTNADEVINSPDVDIVYIAAALVATCMLGAFGAHLWSAYSGHHWYLEEGVRGSNAYEFVVALGSFFLLNYQFIPVSLYVSISMVNTINATFVRQDVEMYDEAADECVGGPA